MTEPVPQWHVFDREAHLQAHIVKRLRAAGWLVIVTSQDRRTRKQLADIPDLLCFRRGMTLLIECKTPDGEMRPGQVEFAADLTEHVGPQLQYCVARYLGDVEAWQ